MLHTWRVQLRSPLLSLCLGELGEKNEERYVGINVECIYIHSIYIHSIYIHSFDFYEEGKFLFFCFVVFFFLVAIPGKTWRLHVSYSQRAHIFIHNLIDIFSFFFFLFLIAGKTSWNLIFRIVELLYRPLSNRSGRVTIDGLKSTFDLVTFFP